MSREEIESRRDLQMKVEDRCSRVRKEGLESRREVQQSEYSREGLEI